MDNNKEWYVFFKETDMGNDGVDMKIISHLEEHLKFQTEVAAMMILTVVAWGRECI